MLFDGEAFRLVAHRGLPSAVVEVWQQPQRYGPHTGAARAVTERRPVQIVDLMADRAYGERDPIRVRAVELLGARTSLFVPMLKDETPIGVIVTWRREVQAFTESQIQLLSTFADQAVIALENVRLFTELQQKNHALAEAHAHVTEALEQQTATADILKVISSSPTAVQPVFEAIAESAARLTKALSGGTLLVSDGMVNLAAVHAPGVGEVDAFRRMYPIPLDDNTLVTRVVHEGRVFNISDTATDPSLPEPQRRRALTLGARNLLIVPMLRDAQVVGTIFVSRRDPGVFTDKQVTLLQTFAHQAVIAIENVRLFTELGARNRELTEALEQQTATSEILRVISRSPTDVQPVFEAIIQSAIRLCEAVNGGVYRFDGSLIHQVAVHNMTPQTVDATSRVWPRAPDRGTATGRAILTRAVVHVDIAEDPEYAQQCPCSGWVPHGPVRAHVAGRHFDRGDHHRA